MKREYITVQQAAGVAHVAPNTVRRWMTAGRLTKYKIGGRVLVDVKELDALITPVGCQV